MELPNFNHVFYIPLVIAIGAIVGYWWGRRSLRIQLAEDELAKRQREQRRLERRARLAAAASEQASVNADAADSE